MQNLNSCTHFRLKDSQSPLNPTEKLLFRPLAFIVPVLNADITFFDMISCLLKMTKIQKCKLKFCESALVKQYPFNYVALESKYCIRLNIKKGIYS